jgi:DNA-binding CsgD family transcriptional regulator
VKTHLAAVQGKINARNRTEIAAWAWQSGVMD